MSEYQVYEFVALDRSLTSTQIAELRAISTRADITPTRFWNEYRWGQLKVDPATLVERYFDAHLYVASWGSRRLMLRLPATRMHEEQVRPYFLGGAASLAKFGEHIVLDFQSDTEEPETNFASGASLAALVPLRDELLRGDLRAAYLAWLLAVQTEDVPDTDTEPPLPPGLLDLSAPLAAMVDFLRIDKDLLSAAAEHSDAEQENIGDLRAWVASLSARTKDEWLRRAVNEPDLALGTELRRVFRARAKTSALTAPRTVAELRAAANEQRKKREHTEEIRAEKERKSAEVAQKKRLDALATRLDAAWTELERMIANKSYGDALKLAIDLRDLAIRESMGANFAERFKAMRKRQARRLGFFERWKLES